MKAVYKYAPGAFTTDYREMPVPVLDPINNVLVKVDAVTCCGMDNHIYQGKFDCTPPFVMGHEFVGRIAEILPGSKTGLQVGQRVISEPHLYSCGKCIACTSGAPQSCSQRKTLGIQRDGALAEYVKVPAKYLHSVPEELSDEVACIIEPMTILYTDLIRKAKLSQGETVAIWGAGPVGIFAAVTARYAGASKIILVGADSDEEYRLPVAESIGVDTILNFQKDDVVKSIRDLTDGMGVDLAVEGSGSPIAVHQAMESTRINRRVSFLGMTRGRPIEIDWDPTLKKMLSLHFNMMADYQDMDSTIAMAKDFPVSLSPIVTPMGGLKDYEHIFSELAKGNRIKLMFKLDA